MASYRIAWILIICLINESSSRDKVNPRMWDTLYNFSKDVAEKVVNFVTTSCDIKIENLSENRLTDFKSLQIEGKMDQLTMDIEPGKTAIIKARAGTLKFFWGTSGIVSWSIENQNISLVVMWSLKIFKYNESRKNTLWIALTPEKSFDINSWKKFVETNATLPNKFIKKGIFTKRKATEVMTIKNGRFTVRGIMETGKHPTITIKLSSV